MRTFLGALLAVGLMAVVPAPAHAEGATYADTGGDVWAHRGGVSTQEVSHTDGDVQHVTIRHRKRIVRLSMTVSSIDADGGSSFRPTLFRFTLVNGRGLVKVFDLNQHNQLRVRKLVDGHYRATSCRWTHHRVDLARARVAVTLPRTCMRRPKLLRLQATTVDWDKSGTAYVDDAYTAFDSTSPSVKPGSSPWLKRG